MHLIITAKLGDKESDTLGENSCPFSARGVLCGSFLILLTHLDIKPLSCSKVIWDKSIGNPFYFVEYGLHLLREGL